MPPNAFNTSKALRSAATGGYVALVELLVKKKMTDLNISTGSDSFAKILGATDAFETAVETFTKASEALSEATAAAAKVQEAASNFKADSTSENGMTAKNAVDHTINAAEDAVAAVKRAIEAAEGAKTAVGVQGLTYTSGGVDQAKKKIQEALTAAGLARDAAANFAAEAGPVGDAAVAAHAAIGGNDFEEKATKFVTAVGKLPSALETAPGDIQSAKASLSAALTAAVAGDPTHQFGQYLNEPDNEGCTPLYLAANGGQTAVVEYFLGLGNIIDCNRKNSKGWSPLRAALSNDHAELAELLLETGKIRAAKKDNDGWNAICQASSGGHFQVVNLLLGKPASGIDEEDADGFTALYLAVNAGHVRVAKRLLEKKASVDKTSRGGLTALFAASNTGNTQLVEALIRAKADPKIRSNEGETPLDTAIGGGHAGAVELLLNTLQAAA